MSTKLNKVASIYLKASSDSAKKSPLTDKKNGSDNPREISKNTRHIKNDKESAETDNPVKPSSLKK